MDGLPKGKTTNVLASCQTLQGVVTTILWPWREPLCARARSGRRRVAGPTQDARDAALAPKRRDHGYNLIGPAPWSTRTARVPVRCRAGAYGDYRQTLVVDLDSDFRDS